MKAEANEGSATVEFVVNEAESIFKKFKKAKIKPRTPESNDFLDCMKVEHPEFSERYGIVIQMIIEEGKFFTGAFKKYLAQLVRSPYKTNLEFLRSQTNYMFHFWRALDPKRPLLDIMKARELAFEYLVKSHDEFTERCKSYNNDIEKLKNNIREERLKELKDHIESLK